MKKYLVIFYCILFLFLSTTISYAQITIQQSNELPDYPQWITSSSNTDESEQVNSEWVWDEVYHLEKVYPLIKNVDCKIFIINKKVFSSQIGSSLIGLTTSEYGERIIYLFGEHDINQSEVAYITTHEIGHLVRFSLIYPDYLDDYISVRNTNHIADGYYNRPEEVFAEDFRYLFGSNTAKQIPYRTNYDKPGLLEKIWMLLFDKILYRYSEFRDYIG